MSLKGLEKFEAAINATVSVIKPVVLKVISIEWEKSIRKNFEAAGRPSWKPRKRISKKQKGTNILVISGALKNYRAYVDESASRVVLVPDPRARDYAKIQNEGGVIIMPARTVRHRIKKFRDGSRRTVFASSRHKRIKSETTTKSYKIIIPKREHTNLPEEDFSRIINSIKLALKL